MPKGYELEDESEIGNSLSETLVREADLDPARKM
jgi:hypothetical protein